MVQLRKVVLADHLAESSVSVDNVSYVICSGKIKENRYDPVKKVPFCIKCIYSLFNLPIDVSLH